VSIAGHSSENEISPKGRLSPGNGSCDILIRTYHRDLEWLGYCLSSIEKFCTGFRSTLVMVPKSTIPWLARSGISTDATRLVVCPDYKDDYLGQQVSKLYADVVTDAELICHVDADCLFSRPVTPGDLSPRGKVRILMAPAAALGRQYPWRRPTEKFLGWRVEYDYMRRPPFTFPRWLYDEVRTFCLEVHGVTLDRYIVSQPPRGFSEFNVLGAFAFERHRDRFDWVDTAEEPSPAELCRWFWSWGGIDAGTRDQIAEILER